MNKFIVSFLLTMLSALGVIAHASNGTRGGGDDVALEFKKYATLGIENLKSTVVSDANRRKLMALLNEINYFVVEDIMPVSIPGADSALQHSAATNNPVLKQIFINRQRWKEISLPAIKMKLATHEVLSVAGLEKTGDYSMSSTLTDVPSAKESCPILKGIFTCMDSFGTLYDKSFNYQAKDQDIIYNLFGNEFIADGVERIMKGTETEKMSFAHVASCSGNALEYEHLKYNLSGFTNSHRERYYFDQEYLVRDAVIYADGKISTAYKNACVPKKSFNVAHKEKMKTMVSRNTAYSCAEDVSLIDTMSSSLLQSIQSKYNDSDYQKAVTESLAVSLRGMEQINEYCQKDCSSRNEFTSYCAKRTQEAREAFQAYLYQRPEPYLYKCSSSCEIIGSGARYIVQQYDKEMLVNANEIFFGESTFGGNILELKRTQKEAMNKCEVDLRENKICNM